MRSLFVLLVLLLAFTGSGAAATAPPFQRPAHPTVPIQTALKNTLQQYLSARGKAEHVSAASLAISLPNRATIDLAAGTTTYGGTTPVTPASLFQIGSNTKVFTAIVMLKLEAAGKVAMTQKVGDWLPEYGPWKAITIPQLFDMTSGIKTYDDTRAWEDDFVANPQRNFSPKELIAYIDPKAPLEKGWHYSNTSYMLSQLIEEKASGRSYTDLVRSLVIAPAHLSATYYFPDVYPPALLRRTVAGYYNNVAAGGGLAKIIGRNMRDDSVSWAQSAGAIVSSPHDLAQWTRDLYQGSIITPKQRAQIETLVSTTTGKPVKQVSASEPRAFGLGVAQIYHPKLGRFWFYEGMTLGYRMVHAYFPAKDLVIVVALNSQPSANQNKIGPLVNDIYNELQFYGLISKN